ncbi:uncharacterized protein [Prorops nasuta]|uniref:uncharacterized protein n=1 Tax=Prorops nasuta TaxID=863751 RepID=UPI0034CD16B0
MFEREDWNFDDEFIKDMDDKLQDYQKCVNDNTGKANSQCKRQKELPAKELKLDNKKKRMDSNANKISPNANLTCNNYEKVYFRQRKSIEVIKGNYIIDNTRKEGMEEQPKKRMCLPLHQERTEAAGTSRRDLIIGILQRQNTQEKVRRIESNVDHCKSVNSGSTFNKLQKFQFTEKSPLKESNPGFLQGTPITNNECTRKDCKESVKTTKRSLHLDVLKKTDTSDTEITTNYLKPHNTTVNSPSNNKKTLIRKFPGPAGLLPDNIDERFCSFTLLFDEDTSNFDTEQRIDQKSPLKDYCSQNTSNLFSEGAWQLMLNDLPPNFLKDYEIAKIKKKAQKNFKNYHTVMKVPLLAGLLVQVDYGCDNPSIVLKDFTDTIPGIMHSDIPLKYPGALEQNVVILLHNVGILKIGMLDNKCQILVLPSSLLGIYSNSGKIVQTEKMTALLHEYSKSKECINLPETLNKIHKLNDDTSTRKNFAKAYQDLLQTQNVDNLDDGMFSMGFDDDFFLEEFEDTTTKKSNNSSSTTIDNNKTSFNLSSNFSQNVKSQSSSHKTSNASEAFGAYMLNDSSNDIEDEIFSQVDVDSIAML